jgi:hypothetical protein
MGAAPLLMIGVERTYRERLRELAGLRGLEAAEPSDEGWIAAAAERLRSASRA